MALCRVPRSVKYIFCFLWVHVGWAQCIMGKLGAQGLWWFKKRWKWFSCFAIWLVAYLEIKSCFYCNFNAMLLFQCFSFARVWVLCVCVLVHQCVCVFAHLCVCVSVCLVVCGIDSYQGLWSDEWMKSRCREMISWGGPPLLTQKHPYDILFTRTEPQSHSANGGNLTNDVCVQH